MGVFNTIGFTCPRCSAIIEAQSKVDGGCSSYSSDQVPRRIASDIEGEHVRCDNCENIFVIARKPQDETVAMGLM